MVENKSLMSVLFVVVIMVGVVWGQSAMPVWPTNTHAVGQWRCMHLGLACANLGSWGQFQSYTRYDSSGNMLNYREDVVVNSTKDQLPYIRELLYPNTFYEFFLPNSSAFQLSCFVRHGTLVWPNNWLQNATYLGTQDFHGHLCDEWRTVFSFMGLPSPDHIFVDIATGMYAGWRQTTGGLEYQWFTYESLSNFPTDSFFDPPPVSSPCSTLGKDAILPWR